MCYETLITGYNIRSVINYYFKLLMYFSMENSLDHEGGEEMAFSIVQKLETFMKTFY